MITQDVVLCKELCKATQLTRARYMTGAADIFPDLPE